MDNLSDEIRRIYLELSEQTGNTPKVVVVSGEYLNLLGDAEFEDGAMYVVTQRGIRKVEDDA